MRRFRQQLPDDEVQQILAGATHGVLSVVDARGLPYGVPMSFVCDGRRLYFHGACDGRKLEGVQPGSRASFCVVAQDEIHPETFTTYYRSVIAEGPIVRVEEPGEVRAALRMLGGKYAPGRDSASEIDRSLGRVAVLRLTIEQACGKEAIELTRQRDE